LSCPYNAIDGEKLIKQTPSSFGDLGILERADLQRLLRQQAEVLAEDLVIVAEEFGNWEDSKRRIDLLALDRSRRLVVIELKRTADGGHMELQAIRYAAMVSAMTFDEVVAAYNSYRTSARQPTQRTRGPS
jgi:RecB family endonuclease NucS